MKTTIYLPLILILCSLAYINGKPSPTISREKRKCLRVLKYNVKKYWHYNPDTKLYSLDTEFLGKPNNQSILDCMDGMDTSYAYAIFGKQHTKVVSYDHIRRYAHRKHITDSTTTYLDYPIKEGSWENDHLKIYFKSNGTIRGVELSYERRID